MQMLITRLRDMEANESDVQKKKAIAQSTSELTGYIQAINGNIQPMGDNVYSLFGDEGNSGKTKKH